MRRFLGGAWRGIWDFEVSATLAGHIDLTTYWRILFFHAVRAVEPSQRHASIALCSTHPPNPRLLFNRPTVFTPTFTPHTLLHSVPYPLYHLPVSPPTTDSLLRVPLLNHRTSDAPPPTPDRTRHVLTSPPDIYPQRILEQVWSILPFVALELPRLPRGKDRNDAVPVIRFELLRGVDQDEAKWSLGVDRGK